PDVGVHALVRAATTVEVVDSEREDRGPAGPVAGVEVERLEVALAERQVISSLVTRGVHTTRFEKQRPALPAADDVGQPCGGFTLHPADRAGRALRLGVVGTGLIEERWIETEGTHAPARIDTQRVTL